MRKITALLVALFLSACQPSEDNLHGYVEGEYLMIAPTSGGLLETLSVKRGQQVKLGDPLFSLDLTELVAQRDKAIADVGRLQAELDDLLKGERPEELEIILKQKEQVIAVLTKAEADYNRGLALHKVGAVSVSDFEEMKASLDSAKARKEELEAQLKTAKLGARVDKIESAEASLLGAQQSLIQAEKQLADAAPLAPAAGLIEETFYRPSEHVSAGQAVVKLLPPENVKVRFYVPQKVLPKLAYGKPITVSCDGCIKPIKAKVSYISTESEFTPPVIYSVGSRDKLVFLIEAVPDEVEKELHPGLPVDIDLGL